jgi:hypothetical protein
VRKFRVIIFKKVHRGLTIIGELFPQVRSDNCNSDLNFTVASLFWESPKQAYNFQRFIQINPTNMKQVYYKGQPYEYEVVNLRGKRQFKLYKDGALMHSVEQAELDIKSLVSLILEAYYKNSKTPARSVTA